MLYELCTNKDDYVLNKTLVLLEWIEKLQINYNSSHRSLCNNPQSGFVKCIASILWYIYEKNYISNLSEHITANVFNACMHWIDRLDHEEPLKISFDTLLCSLCYIQPKFFTNLLKRLNVNLASHNEADLDVCKNENNECGLTDDKKEISGRLWYANVATDNLSTIFAKPSYLATIAMACQSPNTVFLLVDSGLPKLLAYALFEYCSSLFIRSDDSKMLNYDQHDNLQYNSSSPTSSASHLTDADKVAGDKMDVIFSEANTESSKQPIMTFDLVSKILDFFSECCSEGHMRDWLGSQQGSLFWKPLLRLLCNHRPIHCVSPMHITSMEPTQQAFIRIERATINFFSKVTACHPNNQNILTILLIEVIKEPSITMAINPPESSSKQTISSFTRQLVLQLLLENERILVSVRSKQPLQKKDLFASCLPLTANIPATNNSASSSSITMMLINHHPSRRISNHHLLFSASANTKCQEIIQNCLSGKLAKYCGS